MKVHPDADIFPMMPDDELAVLAEDIKANGLIHPIITGDFEGGEVLVDGRNRLRACEMAGVKPTFRKLNGEDQKAFILSVNINRRHMTAGQRAMATAVIYPTPTKLKRKRAGQAGSGRGPDQIDSSILAKARAVLAFAPDLASAVLAGSVTLNDAHAKVKQDRLTLESTEASMARLRAEAPDIADLVVEEKLKLAEGLSALDARITETRRQQETATRV